MVGDPESHVPSDQNTKTWNRSNIVTKSIKTLKMVHIKKKNRKEAIVLLGKHVWVQRVLVFLNPPPSHLHH